MNLRQFKTKRWFRITVKKIYSATMKADKKAEAYNGFETMA